MHKVKARFDAASHQLSYRIAYGILAEFSYYIEIVSALLLRVLAAVY